MADFSSDGKGSITTTSRVRVWWLTTVGGYRVENKRRVPNENAFGELYYKNTWVLVKDGEGKA